MGVYNASFKGIVKQSKKALDKVRSAWDSSAQPARLVTLCVVLGGISVSCFPLSLPASWNALAVQDSPTNMAESVAKQRSEEKISSSVDVDVI